MALVGCIRDTANGENPRAVTLNSIEESGFQELRKGGRQEAYKIFVGGLTGDISERQLERAFDRFGKIIECRAREGSTEEEELQLKKTNINYLEMGGGDNIEELNKKPRHKGKHDKPKPWDEDPNIDHWKIETFDPSWNDTGLLDLSSFSTLFPKYREKYLQEAWPSVKSALNEYGVACELNLVDGSMTVSTTRKTRDPYIIVKARDLIHLLARSVPAPQAIKILDDEWQCDIIKIGNLVRNKERFVKRRQHLVGPNSSTLKALEILTGCYILVQGNTVAAMGPYKGLKQVRRIVEDCIKNKMHPVYHIKILMMRKELEKDPTLANESWDRFLPKFKKKNVKQKKVRRKEKKPYTPFPPPPQPSKIDLQLESGEYFLSDQKKLEKKWNEKREKQVEKTVEGKRKREAAFIPPEEPAKSDSDKVLLGSNRNDVTAMAVSLKKKAKEFGKHRDVHNIDPQNYLA